jgi:O-acetyl-ADP-ribose deacetylase (regulator of RNase III)
MKRDATFEILQVGSSLIKFVQGDITDQSVDAIVNAANSSLMGGGGVDGAIHRAGGPVILKECIEIRKTPRWRNGVAPGEAVLTSGGSLSARYVIHTVGPIWTGSSRDVVTLESAYRNSLAIAASNEFQRVAFPSISTGAYGYPIKEASKIALKTVREHLEKYDYPKEIVFVLFSKEDFNVYVETAKVLN